MTSKQTVNLHGLLVVDKPGLTPETSPDVSPGTRLLTSHDVVQRVRRWSGQRRIGHTGTLDPFASGVLVLCLGQATRLVEYYQGHDKHYHAVVTLGTATDTYDSTGMVVESAPVPALDAAAIEDALTNFRGAIMQTPPIYSALKQEGEALYVKARRGETVELTARPVTFYALELLAWQPPATLTLHVHCSAGTYIRSLAHDLGRALGTVGHLAALRREAAGSFTLAQAHTLVDLEAAAQGGELPSLLLPLGTGLDLPLLLLDEVAALRLSQGQKVWLPDIVLGAGTDAIAMAQDAQGNCLGIVRRLESGERASALWKAEKWLAGV